MCVNDFQIHFIEIDFFLAYFRSWGSFWIDLNLKKETPQKIKFYCHELEGFFYIANKLSETRIEKFSLNHLRPSFALFESTFWLQANSNWTRNPIIFDAIPKNTKKKIKILARLLGAIKILKNKTRPGQEVDGIFYFYRLVTVPAANWSPWRLLLLLLLFLFLFFFFFWASSFWNTPRPPWRTIAVRFRWPFRSDRSRRFRRATQKKMAEKTTTTKKTQMSQTKIAAITNRRQLCGGGGTSRPRSVNHVDR